MTDIENEKTYNKYSRAETCGSLCKKVKSVKVHPDFDPETKMPDLAIVKLKNGFSIHYFDNWPKDILKFTRIFGGAYKGQ